MTTPNLHAAAMEALQGIERRDRLSEPDGCPVYYAEAKSARWIHSMFDAAHVMSGEWGPTGRMDADHWRHWYVMHALLWITDGGAIDSYEFGKHVRDAEILLQNRTRLDWIGSNGARPEYVDQAIDDYLSDLDGVMSMIGMGALYEAQEVFNSVVCSLMEHANTTEEGGQ